MNKPSPYRIDTIPDGSSHTIAMMEDSAGSFPGSPMSTRSQAPRKPDALVVARLPMNSVGCFWPNGDELPGQKITLATIRCRS